MSFQVFRGVLQFNPMNSETFRRTLAEEATRLGIEISAEELDAFRLHYELLRKWNERVRLVGTAEPERAAIELFADSLAACRFAGALGPGRTGDATRSALNVIDIGSGAGLPGVSINTLRPDWSLTFVEANAKKISFLKSLSRELGLTAARIAHGRAEALAREPAYRESFDLAFCRAVAVPPVACELAVPFLKIGGSFILQTSAHAGDAEQQKALEKIRRAAEALGSTLGRTTSYSLSDTKGQRMLIEITKKSETPQQFPRDSKTIKKKPLS